MADFEKVQLQVEVVRTQLDSLIKDVNNLKAQKLNFTVDSSGLEAINRFNSSVQAMTQNVDGLSGKFTRIWAGAADGAPTRTIETVNEGLGRTTEIIRTLDEETQQYTTVQTKATTNYDAMAKAAQKAAEKAEKAAKEQAKETENAASKVDTLRKGFADLGLQMKSAAEKYPTGTFSEIESDAKQASAALENLYSSWKNGAISDKEFVAGVKDASGSLKNLRANYAQTRNETDKLTNSTNVLGDTFSHIVGKITVWQVVNAAVAKVKRSFTEAIDTMKQVDTEMTAIQKVTGNTSAEMEKLGNTAYEAASKYGVAVTDYLESVGTFAKAGYKDMSEDMAELATKTQLVGDVTSSIANQFILSADAAFKFEGNVTALNTVLDKANEIENHYATSIQKMAEGFPIVANVASMANMSIDQLISMLGTITAVTQESGTKAATAARALILNIIGDTETELEDGITWTKEEIESLNQVLWTYSEDAMKAAQATGSIVNPMEAVAGLAKAYKEGVLTQAELAQIESDLGGKLRTNQLDALIKNYDMYAAMLDKVANSAGSADKEVDIMLTSWDAKAKILNNTWTEFISHMVDTDVAKGSIELLTDAVEILDSDFGHVVITAAAVATSIYGIGIAVGAVKKAFAAFNLASLNPWVLAVAGLATVIGIAAEATKELRKSYEELNSEIDENTSKIDQNKQKIEEINKLPWNERTAAILAERDALEQENRQLERQNELLDERKKRKAEGELSSANRVVTEEYSNNFTVTTGDDYYKLLTGELTRYGSEMSATGQISEENARGFEQAREEAGKLATAIEILGYDSEKVTDKQREMYDAYMKMEGVYDVAVKVSDAMSKFGMPLEEAKRYVEAQEQSATATEDASTAQDGYSESLSETGESAKTTTETLQEYAKTLKQQESDLTTASQALAEYQQNGRVSASTMKSLISMSDQYVNALTDENGKLDVSEKKLRDLVDAILDDVDATNDLIGVTKKSSGAMGSFVTGLKNAAKQSGVTDDAIDGVVAQMIIFNNTALSVSDKIAALQALALQAGVTQSAIAGISLNNIGRDAGMTVEDAQKKYGMSAAEAQRYVKSQAEKAKNNDQALIDYWNSLASKIPETKTSSGGGGGSSSDANLEAHKQKVELLKSELTLLEKQNASEDTQKDKMRQIQQALHAQAQYLRSIGGSQSDINALSAEWWEWQEKINGTLKNTDDLLNELQGVMSDKLSDLSDQRQNELDAIDAQIDALKQQKETRDEQLDLEEKILAVQQAQAKLADAQNERTVRQYNARTGQWEWVADQKEVDSAQKALDEAKKDLEDFKANMAYEAALAELEAKKDAINAQYDALEKNYNNFLKSLKEKTRGIGEILQDIWKNATPELRQIIQENAELFRQFGFDVSQLSNAVKETEKKLYGVSANGARYEIGSDRGIDFVNNAKPGESIIGGDGSTWTKNEDGTVTIVDKNGISYVVNPGNGTGDSSGGSNTGPKYSGTVWAIRLDGKGENYKISSANGLNFLNNALAGEELNGGDGSHWVKNADGTTSITDKYGIAYKVYDRGGILHGMGGIKATTQDEGITPPDVTAMLKKRVLTPVEDRNFSQNMDSIRWMMSSNGVDANAVHNASYDNHSIGTQNNGNVYKFNGITINEPQASGMTLKQFADIAHNLGNFS
jgi:TP901 family phage tail tape measure protein